MTREELSEDAGAALQRFSGRRRVAFVVMTLAILALLGEGAAWLVFATIRPNYELVRKAMLGEPNTFARFQKSIGQPYLLYVPAPGHRRGHNEQGYRGKPVPMRRQPGVARVLCLGGSTTYGDEVDDPENTYPAAMERILTHEKPAQVAGVEVINAGLPWGTSAEEYIHYHFKFHFFRPDVVVINSGGNDIAPILRSYYQPDYSHWRKALHDPQALPDRSRWLMQSRLISFFVIYHFRAEYVAPDAIMRPDLPPATHWYPDYDRRGRENEPIPEDELAYIHNLSALVEEIQRDGAKVLLVAFRESPDERKVFGHDPRYLAGQRVEGRQRRELEIIRRQTQHVAERHAVPYLPYPAETISPENWVDWCHLNAAGERQKAAYVAPAVAKLLWGGAGSAVAAEGGAGARAAP